MYPIDPEGRKVLAADRLAALSRSYRGGSASGGAGSFRRRLDRRLLPLRGRLRRVERWRRAARLSAVRAG